VGLVGVVVVVVVAVDVRGAWAYLGQSVAEWATLQRLGQHAEGGVDVQGEERLERARGEGESEGAKMRARVRARRLKTRANI